MKYTVHNLKVKTLTTAIISVASIAMLSGCANIPLTSSRFSSASNLHPEQVETGVVLRTMPIKIDNSSKVVQSAGIGAGAGGIVGGIGGALMGNTVIGAVAGALGGGIIGDAITPNSGVGTDIFVRLSTGQTLSIPEAGIVHLAHGEQVFVMKSGRGNYRVEPANQPISTSGVQVTKP